MLFVIVYLVIGIIFAAIGSKMARGRGRDPAIWAVICFLFPLIGVLALALAGPASGAGVLGTQKNRWLALVELDPEIREVALRARAHGEKYEMMLAERYLALNDKSYLPAIEDAVAKQINADEAESAKRIEKYKKR